MKIVHPKSEPPREARNKLLTQALRPKDTPFPIADEYPIVLNPYRSELSYCLVAEDNDIVAHLNLWPRTVRYKMKDYKLGLVGNVATAENHRGHGHMAHLLEQVTQTAQESLHLDALILWSDLHSFYQKQGFRACGKERRYFFDRQKVSALETSTDDFTANLSPIDPELSKPWSLQSLLELRKTADDITTVQRQSDEFAMQLTIPSMGIWLNGDKSSYLVLGKGMDMAGVVHEWGAKSPEAALAGIKAIFRDCDYQQIILLAPALPDTWEKTFTVHATAVEQHPMAWGRSLTPSGEEVLDRVFIWGLDGI